MKSGAPKASPFETKAFRRLQRIWYAKLAASGFVDIEGDEANAVALRDRHLRERASVVVEANSEYYRMCERYLFVGEFSTVERQVWTLHAAGHSVRSIADRLGLTKTLVHARVEKHRAKMRLSGVADIQTADPMDPGEGNQLFEENYPSEDVIGT